MSDFDSPWKEALEIYFERFVAFFFPAMHADIDWARGHEFLDKELQQVAPDGETRRRVVDKLVKVWRRNGAEEWVLIHIEVQSQYETEFPQRMYVYNYRLFDRYNRKVVSLAILGDDHPHWRPDNFGYSLWGCTVSLQFPVVKLIDFAAVEQALQTHENLFALVVLAHLKSLETRHDANAREVWKVRLVKSLYERGLSAVDVRQLFRFIDWMMTLPRPLEGLFWQEIAHYEEEKQMPFITTPERLGLEKGLLKGIAAVLEVRFGEAGLRLLPEIREIQDHEKLDALLDAIKTVKTPEELRAYWTNERDS